MRTSLPQQIAELPQKTVKQLKVLYGDLFGEVTTANNKAWLIKRIAWRLQVRAHGGLSDRAKQRATELADDAEIRLNPPPTVPQPPSIIKLPDNRLPPAGTVLSRTYKGKVLQVLIRDDGFEYAGQIYSSLSAVAKVITGGHCNGFHFFKLPRGKQ
ncbi:MAG: DUF2924 domain-containing protein [Zavarzinella sp.]